MVAQRSIIGYFGAQVKQPKRKGNPSAENTVVIEKKHCDSPAVRVRKFQESWKETFLWVVHDVNEDVMYCSICTGRKYPSFANLQSSLYIGCGSGGKFPIDSLVHHNVSKEHYSCSLQSFKSAGHGTNRPFYRYGGHIELIQFKEYYRMPRGHEHISFVFSSAFRDIFP